MSELWKQDTYLDKNVDYIISSNIVEYDMVSSGLSIIKEHNMLPIEKIEELSELPKHKRNVAIGLIMRSDKEFAKIHRTYLREHRRDFIEANNILDDEILSIKSDAIFVTRKCQNTEFGYVTFSEKNEYTSYYYLNKKEIYVGEHNIDIKGIRDEIVEKYHSQYFCKELWNLMKLLETSDMHNCIRRLRRTMDMYKNLEFPVEYYRELSPESLYRLKGFKHHKKMEVMASQIGDKDILDISYNYIRYLVPLVSLLI